MIDFLTLRENVRKRPAMYLGNDNVNGVITGLISESIAATGSSKLSVTVEIQSDNKLSMTFTGSEALHRFGDRILSKTASVDHASLLSVITSRLQVSQGGNVSVLLNGDGELRTHSEKGGATDQLDLSIELDTSIYEWGVRSFSELSEQVELWALLNRDLEVLLRDVRGKHTEQRYFNFPEGVFAFYNGLKAKALGTPVFEITCDSTVGDHRYQIALGYRTDWYPPPSIFSFANDVHNTGGGSLVDGVIEGLLAACRKYVKEQSLSTYKISKNRVSNGLILVCAVRGEDFKYGGSWKETLESDLVEAEAKKLVRNAVLDFIKSNKEKADKFLWRFDQSHITSAMLKDRKS